MVAGVAALDDAVLPLHLEHLGSDTRGRRIGIGAEIAAAVVDVQLAVRMTERAVRLLEPGGVLLVEVAALGAAGRRASHAITHYGAIPPRTEPSPVSR